MHEHFVALLALANKKELWPQADLVASAALIETLQAPTGAMLQMKTAEIEVVSIWITRESPRCRQRTAEHPLWAACQP